MWKETYIRLKMNVVTSPWTLAKRAVDFVWLIIWFFFLVAAQDSTAQSVHYNFDSVGRLTHVAYADGSSVEYVYDALGNRLVNAATVTGNSSNQPPSVVTNLS